MSQPVQKKTISLRIEQYMKQFHSSTDKSPKADIARFVLWSQILSSTSQKSVTLS
jgi:hypothetical protein